MGRKRPQPPTPHKPSAAPEGAVPWREAACAAVAALLIALFLYSPALHAPFFFDDNVLNIRLGERDEPITTALTGRRPVLSASYWLDYQWSGDDPAGYRDVNLVIHALATGLVFLVLFRLLALAGWDVRKRRIAAAIGACVFLIHPLQTESVAYIAGRSESLCALFMLASYAVFLYRPDGGIWWPRAAAVLLLAGAATATKENAVALGGVFLLTDLFWGRDAGWKSIRANWRLYAPAVALGAAAAAVVWRMLATAETAGFEGTGIHWYEYGLTEARAIWTYVRMAILPFGQSVDHDFAVSRTPFEHGAILYLLALGGVVALAILARERFRAGAFGLLLFLVLLAPTSSVIPIADPLVERRVYLPLLGLILAGCELVGRLRRPQLIAGGLSLWLLWLAVLTIQRNTLWGHPEQMWIDTATRSIHKSRPYLHLSEMLVGQNRCAEALPYLERAERLMPRDEMVQVGIAKALECLGRRDEALARLERAAADKPTSAVYQWMGLLLGAMGRSAEAGAALKKAVQQGPRNSEAHSALGLWYESIGDRAAAIEEYRKTLEFNQYNPEARAGLTRLTGKPR